MLKVDDAHVELATKGIITIHAETAWKWASRAAAAFEVSSESQDPEEALQFLIDGLEYFSEAKEHAAQVSGALVEEITDAVVPYQADAMQEG